MGIKRQYEIITHEVTEEICTGETRYCDVCNKEIPKRTGYWNVIMGNYDQRHRESEDFDICSEFCLMSKVAEYIDKSSDTDESEYIEIERSYDWK